MGGVDVGDGGWAYSCVVCGEEAVIRGVGLVSLYYWL